MSIDAILDKLYNSVNELPIYIEEFIKVIVAVLQSVLSGIDSATKSIQSPIEFTDLQLTLLKVLLLILFSSLVLIGIYWRKYGEVITDKFIRPSTQKEIEELKLSVAKLKLPKEHSPRI